MLDPFSIETRFALEDGMGYLDSISDEVSEDTRIELDRLKGVLSLLPKREADFVELYYFRKLKQTDIASIFKVSQPTVCYRLNRATIRVRFMLGLPQVDEEQMARDLRVIFPDPLDGEIMQAMYTTTCQSEVARLLGVSQGLVRHRFLRSLRVMKSLAEYHKQREVLSAAQSKIRPERDGWTNWNALGRQIAKLDLTMDRVPEEVRARPDFGAAVKSYHAIFEYIGDNLSILREVSKPIEDPKVFLID